MGEVLLSASELAGRLGVSKGRISQYVAAGQLTGCFRGDGRARRFDLAKVGTALGRNLDLGQMMGNGAATRRILADLRDDAGDDEPEQRPKPETPKESGELSRGDTARYEMARTAKAEEDLRAARLRNGREEGLYVLASEVETQVSRVMAKEISAVEMVLYDGARVVADKMGVDFRAVRQILLDTWRAHRAKRAEALGVESVDAAPTEAERAGDI